MKEYKIKEIQLNSITKLLETVEKEQKDKIEKIKKKDESNNKCR